MLTIKLAIGSDLGSGILRSQRGLVGEAAAQGEATAAQPTTDRAAKAARAQAEADAATT